ncbi:amidohydrolase family protein [Nakamurella sp. GG22]
MTAPDAITDQTRQPRRLFDSHLHIVDPGFPLVENQGFLPEPFGCADYRASVRRLPVIGGAVVSGSFQAFDQSYLIAALRTLGSGFIGVTQLPADCPDDQITALHDAGVRAVRFNLVRGATVRLDDIEQLSRRAYAIAGWHSEFYVRNADLAELRPLLDRLPRISIDHLGLTTDGLPELLRLAGAGASVKATGFARTDLDVVATLRSIHRAHPGALMFGTDLPGTRAPRPFQVGDLNLITAALDPADHDRVLCGNALALYRPAVASHSVTDVEHALRRSSVRGGVTRG